MYENASTSARDTKNKVTLWWAATFTYWYLELLLRLHWCYLAHWPPPYSLTSTATVTETPTAVNTANAVAAIKYLIPFKFVRSSKGLRLQLLRVSVGGHVLHPTWFLRACQNQPTAPVVAYARRLCGTNDCLRTNASLRLAAFFVSSQI